MQLATQSRTCMGDANESAAVRRLSSELGAEAGSGSTTVALGLKASHILAQPNATALHNIHLVRRILETMAATSCRSQGADAKAGLE